MVEDRGYQVIRDLPGLATWADAALSVAEIVLDDAEQRARWLRHGGTWFVGVDALPTAADAGIGGIAFPSRLRGIWPGSWHRAQLSAVYPGYPGRDPGESDAAHRFRRIRDAAHVDGLHLEAGRRVLREPHAFILGVPLSRSTNSPLVVWEGSHDLIREALRGAEPGDDVTEAYTAARAEAFERCARIEVQADPGDAILVHRLAVHGIAPWDGAETAPRIMAYFRPCLPRGADWTGAVP